MNSYIDLLNQFYDFCQCNSVTAYAQLLYFKLLQINNRCNWSVEFQRTNVSLCSDMGISETALSRARNELKQLGLVDFRTSKKRGTCTIYSILYLTKQGTKEVQKEYKKCTEEVQKTDIKDIDIDKDIKKVSDDTQKEAAAPQKIMDVVDSYHEICTSYPKVIKISEQRKKAVSARLKKYSLDEIRLAFQEAEGSDFLKGSNNRNWHADFDWIMSDRNLPRIMEGKYRELAKPGNPTKQTAFHNFDTRIGTEQETDYDALEEMLAGRRGDKT